jgi:hypothetical protein
MEVAKYFCFAGDSTDRKPEQERKRRGVWSLQQPKLE